MQMVKSSAEFVEARVIDGHTHAIMEVRARMAEHLSPEQSHLLADVLGQVLGGEEDVAASVDYLAAFLSAKEIEGCSARTVKYYQQTLQGCLMYVGKPVRHFTANDVRAVLSWHKAKGCSDRTIDNIRRVMSSFFQWLENEDIIRKSPVKKVGAVRCEKIEKHPFSEMEVENMRACCKNDRERAIVELLLSSGMRIGELVRLNRLDVDLAERQCEVLGKGRKRRMCYFSAAAEKYLRAYLDSRSDDEEALIVSETRKNGGYNRLSIAGAEQAIRKLGERAGVENCHPHRFRRTMATTCLRRGMPLEEVQLLLGHENMDTTLIYAKTDKEKLRLNARRLT